MIAKSKFFKGGGDNFIYWLMIKFMKNEEEKPHILFNIKKSLMKEKNTI